MSDTEHAKATPETGKGGAAADPSMEDILASIRRILAEEETPPAPSPAPQAGDGVLQLDASMLVPEPSAPPVMSQPEPVLPMSDPAPIAAPVPAHAAPLPGASAPMAEPPSSLVDPAAAAAAASSVGSLVRTLMVERGTQVHSAGPTLEDIVRSELRPLLKDWLDTYLPPLVERLVRVEIERVVGRAVP
jgi:cell pole-organizing protein PopZ